MLANKVIACSLLISSFLATTAASSNDDTETKGPVGNSDGAPRFIYQTKCTEFENKKYCFSLADAGFKDVIVRGKDELPYGTIKVQSVLAQWPKGEVSEDSDGNKWYWGHLYDGYLQNSVADEVVFSDLENLPQVSRWASKAVVQVYGDRCMLNQTQPGTSYPDNINWQFAATPGTGFFIAPDLIVTELSVALKFEEADDDYWLGGVEPNPLTREKLSCQDKSDIFYDNPDNIIEVGVGPIIQTFDGTWGSGEVVAKSEHFALIKLEKGSKDSNLFIDDWQSWSSVTKDISTLQISPADVSRDDSVAAVHNPLRGRGAGGWHITPGNIINNCEDWFDLSIYGGSSSDAFAIDIWSDSGSLGAPILNKTGHVVGMIKGRYPRDPDECYGTAHTNQNSLGVLSTFFADPKSSTVALGSLALREFISAYDDQQVAVTNADTFAVSDHTSWPLNGNTLATANFEVVDHGDSFTTSGFPKSEIKSPAFHTIKQATVMYIAAQGCSICEAGNLTDDFSDSCLCTGFAVSKNLIVVNDHCVSALAQGAETTFKTFHGQMVTATLVNRTSLDSGDIWEKLQTGPNPDNSPNNTKGDVALLRTDQEMDLVPIEFADSNQLSRRQPLITVGHPSLMLRSGPYVTSAGAFIGHDVSDRSKLYYTLPSAPGASGSGVFDLDGKLVGQIAWGQVAYMAANDSWVKSELGNETTSIDSSSLHYPLRPRPFLVGPRVQVGLGGSSAGSSSNHIRDLIEYWAPGELPVRK